MISIQTNYASMVSQNNMNTNSNLQTKTIEALTSGYRINNSGDDPAGLAVANRFRSSVAELTQGVINANSGVSTLQIIDGGLNNISTMLDRLKTLATESASTTFSGDRNNINVEYQQLVGEISQQATNVGLNNGGAYNVSNQVYVGGATTIASAQVSIDLSGTQNSVDASGLGLTNTSVAGGGTELATNTVRLDAPGANFLANAGTQSFTFNLIANGSATSITATVTGAGGAGGVGSSESDVLNQLNGKLNQYGINAQVGTDGQLQFAGSTPFTVAAGAGPADAIATPTTSVATNLGTYNVQGAAAYAGKNQVLTFQNGNQTATVTLLAADTVATATAKINAQTSALGIYALATPGGGGISFQSSNNFTASTDTAAGVFTNVGAQTVAAPSTTASTTGNALAAVTAINSALAQLGNTQARVGAGENKLQYAIDLANSQITNFSSAESQLRDADVAKEAANLTKAQVMQQASVAAMAQANSAPQAVLKLLQ